MEEKIENIKDKKTILLEKAITLALLTPALLIVLLAIFYVPATDSSARLDKIVETEQKVDIVARLREARPDFDYKIVGPSTIPGYIKVAVNDGPTLHVSEDGSHFIDGATYEISKTGFVDIEDKAMMPLRASAIAELELSEMIIFKPQGETLGVLTVFTDIDCGYCRKLHAEMTDLNSLGIEVRYLAYPRAGVDSSSGKKTTAAWCAKDRKTALTRLKRGENLPANKCDDMRFQRHYALGSELGVTGTPAIILPDGTLIAGYKPAEDFARDLGL